MRSDPPAPRSAPRPAHRQALGRARAALAVLAIGVLPSVASPPLAAPAHLPPPAQATQDGTEAAAGRWTVAGGSTSASGSSRTRPVLGPVAAAWEYRPGGVIEGEPLVWDDKVFLTSRESERSRSLHVLDLATGKPMAYPRSYAARAPLEPAIWGRVAVVRAAPDTLEAVQYGGRRLAPIWRYDAGGLLSGHVVRGAEVWAAGDGGLTAVRIGAREPHWKLSGTYRGRPLLVGEELWVSGYDASDRVAFVRVDAATGENQRVLGLGAQAGGIADATLPFSSAHSGTELFLVLPDGRGLAGPGFEGGGADAVWLTPGSGGTNSFRRVRFPVPPVVWRDTWVGYLGDDEGGLRLARDRANDARVDVLASATHHPEFLAGSGSPTLLGDVLYAGGNAVDLETRRILWRSGRTPDRRVVPARETALLVEDGRTLVALRRKRAPESAPLFLQRSTASRPLAVPKGVLVVDDGTVVNGGFRHDAGADRWEQVAGGREGWPEDEVLLVEDADHAIEFTAGPRSALRAIELLEEEASAEDWTLLALDARNTNDAALIERLHAEAWGRGADAVQLEPVALYLEKLASTSWRIDTRRAAEIEARAVALENPGGAAFWTRAAALPKKAPPELREALLAATLEREPDHAGAADAVRALLPRGAAPAQPFDAREWLRFVAAARQTGVERETADAAGGSAWASENLVIVSDFDRPGAMAHAISLGELVCEALDDFFAGGLKRRRNDDPLRVQLYSSQKQYLEVSAGRDPHGLIANSAGYFDSFTDVSHIFVPEGADAYEGTRETLAHELTHHWLHVRCPRLSEEQAARTSAETPGFWVVEGFASLVDDFVFDLEGRSWETFDPNCETLDVATGVDPAQLLDWELVLTANQLQFASLGFTPRVKVPLASSLGLERQLNDSGLFYVQAALVCQYLYHAENGRRRKALRNYLLGHYAGVERDLLLRRMFGMEADELGAAALEWARAGVAKGN